MKEAVALIDEGNSSRVCRKSGQSPVVLQSVTDVMSLAFADGRRNGAGHDVSEHMPLDCDSLRWSEHIFHIGATFLRSHTGCWEKSRQPHRNHGCPA
jgi:hypothetical protein